jgi:hypothetical protein
MESGKSGILFQSNRDIYFFEVIFSGALLFKRGDAIMPPTDVFVKSRKPRDRLTKYKDCQAKYKDGDGLNYAEYCRNIIK